MGECKVIMESDGRILQSALNRYLKSGWEIKHCWTTGRYQNVLVEKSCAVHEMKTRSIMVERPDNNVVVEIMYDRFSGKYCFVNLTKGHVCECRFNTYEDAENDLRKQQQNGNVINWWYI